jgi:hypothetical protein
MQTRRRPRFAELPADVRQWAEQALSGPVVRTEPAHGGYSPGVTESLFTATGRAGFIKAGHPSLNPDSPTFLRAEGRALAAMPGALPIAALIDELDQGDDGWVALLLEHVPGVQAPLPWTAPAVEAALTSLADLAAALTPAPVGEWQSARVALRGMFRLWPRLADCADLDPWLLNRLPQLADAAARALDAAEGDTLVHLDLRADNLMRRSDGCLVVVDWAWAVVGVAWIDPVLLAIEFISSGEPGLDVDAILTRIAAEHGIHTSIAVDTLAGILGFFEAMCREPDPPGLPTLRAFQRFQADALRGWLRASPLAAHLQVVGPDDPAR